MANLHLTGFGARVVLVAALLGGSSACGSSASRSPLAFKRDLASWSLPLDDYQPPYADVSDYATNLLIQRCMHESGYAWAIPPVDPARPGPATQNRVGRKLFSLQLAERYGYRSAPDLRELLSFHAFQRLNERHPRGREGATYQRCSASAHAQLRAPTDVAVETAAARAYNGSLRAEGVQAAIGRWRQCLAAHQITHVPSSPVDMPPPSYSARFRGALRPGRLERRVATNDARCRAASGYSRTVYNAEFDLQLRYLAANVDAWQRVRSAVNAFDKQVEATIVALGKSRPTRSRPGNAADQ